RKGAKNKGNLRKKHQKSMTWLPDGARQSTNAHSGTVGEEMSQETEDEDYSDVGLLLKATANKFKNSIVTGMLFPYC
ncbi:hypothetical protein J6590_069513, partial [Homalodisca vitripennis]